MKIVYETEDITLACKEGQNLLEVCINNKLPISHSCEGMASCGTCRVIVTSDLGDLPERNFLEQEMANDRNFSPKERLACQLIPSSDLRFKLPNE